MRPERWTPGSSSASRTLRSTRRSRCRRRPGRRRQRRRAAPLQLHRIAHRDRGGHRSRRRGADRVAPRLRRAEDYQADFAVLDRLRRVRSLAVEEYVYARPRTDRPVKVTLPSPLMLGYSGRRSTRRRSTTTPFDALRRRRARSCARSRRARRLGCAYIQIDAPELARLGPGRGARALRRAQRLAGAGDGAPLHRRSSTRSSPTSRRRRSACTCAAATTTAVDGGGGYERLPRTSSRAPATTTFLLEYDDERAGSFEPLADVPHDKTSSSACVDEGSTMETPEEIRGRIEAAAEHLPLERSRCRRSAASRRWRMATRR